MINFNDIKYERIDYDKSQILVNVLLEKLVNCSEYLELVSKKIYDIIDIGD